MSTLTYDTARRLVERAVAHADQLGVAVSIAVVDGSGTLAALARMDGASFASPEIAWGKAWTSAAFGAPSGTVADNLAAAPAFTAAVSAMTHGRFTPRQGALPLPGGGGVGASGATREQDEEIVRAALAAT